MNNLHSDNKVRFTARFSAAIQEKIQAAASMTGATLNQFMVEAALEKADRLMERETIISLTHRDAAMLLEMLDQPVSRNEVLGRAYERYNKMVQDAVLDTTAGS